MAKNKESKLPRLLTADDLMDRWNRNIHELTELVRNFNLSANRGYKLLDPNSAIRAIVSNCTFNLTDVEQFENEYPELRPKDVPEEKEPQKPIKTKEDEAKEISSYEDFVESDLTIKNHENVFYRKGDNWVVKYYGKSTLLRDLKRLRYIICLLEKPYNYFNVTDLIKHIKGDEVLSIEDNYNEMNEEQLAKEGLSLCDSLPVEHLNKEEKSGIEDRVNEGWYKLKDAKKSGNSKRIEKAQDTWERFRNYMFSEYSVKIFATSQGIKYKFLPKLQKETERARSNVINQINEAIKDLCKNKDVPSLGEHLNEYIIRKTNCVYKPPSDTPPWYISW